MERAAKTTANLAIIKMFEAKTPNGNICADFRGQMAVSDFKSAEAKVMDAIERHLKELQEEKSFDEKPAAANSTANSNSNSSKEEKPLVELIPKDKWKFETPDKQRLRKMEEFSFESHRTLEPAVFHHSSTEKTVYGLNERVPLQSIRLDQVKAKSQVPICSKYLQPVCSVRVDGAVLAAGDENTFGESSEETINIGAELENTRKRKQITAEPGNWYEDRMRWLATCRPQKSSRVDRRQYLFQRKSLSFQDFPQTPTKPSKLRKCATWELTATSPTTTSADANESLDTFPLDDDDNESLSFEGDW